MSTATNRFYQHQVFNQSSRRTWRFSLGWRLALATVVFLLACKASATDSLPELDLTKPSLAYSATLPTTLASWFRIPAFTAGEFPVDLDEAPIETHWLALATETARQVLSWGNYSNVTMRKSFALFSENASRTLYPGVGELLPRDCIGRSRTNGAGVEDPTCFYLKMIFRF